MKPTNQKSSLLFLFVIAFLLFTFPILDIFGNSRFFLGIPVLFLYLLVTWALLIAGIYVVVRKRNQERTQQERN